MPSEQSVSLREHFERLLDQNQKSHDESSKRYREEIERRLESLNELRKEVVQDRAQFQLKEAYDSSLREWSEWRSRINDRITVIETRSITWTAALGIFFTVLQIGIALLMFYLIHK